MTPIDGPPSFEDDNEETKIIPAESPEDLTTVSSKKSQSASPAPAPAKFVQPKKISFPSEPEISEPQDWKQYIPYAALALSIVALALALLSGGGSSFSPSDIEDGSITGGKIASETISLTNLDPDAAQSMQGTTGPEGPTGPAGKDATASASAFKTETVQKNSASNSSTTKSAQVSCPAGTNLLGGGVTTFGGQDVFIKNSGPLLNENGKAVGWEASAEDLTRSERAWFISALATCTVKSAANE